MAEKNEIMNIMDYEVREDFMYVIINGCLIQRHSSICWVILSSV